MNKNLLKEIKPSKELTLFYQYQGDPFNNINTAKIMLGIFPF